MKQRLKLIAKFIAICALVVLSSCEKDLYEEGIKQNNNIKIEQKSFQELLLTKKFSSAYEKVEKSKILKREALQGRTALEDEYNFTIVEQSPVKILTNESDGSITYVMLIERPISENLKFENLILNDKNGILDGRILKYTLSKEAEKDELHGGEILDIIDTEMTTLEIEGRIAIPCVITYTLMCDNTAGGTWPHDHIATQACIDGNINLYVTTQVECGGGGNSEGTFGGPPSGGNTGSGPTGPIGSVPSTGNTNTGPNGNGGGIGTTPSIPTSPIPSFGSHETINSNDPCAKLNNNSQRIAFKQKFKDLNNSARFSKNGETAYFESKDTNNNRVFTFKQPTFPNTTVKISFGTFSFMHVHNDESEIEDENGNIIIGRSIKMMSPGDINVYVSSCQNSANAANVPNTETYGLMISSEGIFAITMLQPDPYPSQIVNFKDMNAEYKIISEQIVNLYPSNSLSDKNIRKVKLQELILKLMKKYNLDNKVGLFEGESSIEPGQTLPTINWTRKTLDNNGTLIETPC